MKVQEGRYMRVQEGKYAVVEATTQASKIEWTALYDVGDPVQRRYGRDNWNQQVENAAAELELRLGDVLDTAQNMVELLEEFSVIVGEVEDMLMNGELTQ